MYDTSVNVFTFLPLRENIVHKQISKQYNQEFVTVDYIFSYGVKEKA